jgi:hypothetical protein
MLGAFYPPRMGMVGGCMFRFLVFSFFCLAGFTHAKVIDQLELLTEIRPGDSIVTITQNGAQSLSVSLLDSARSQARKADISANAAIIAKLKASADAESIPWVMNEFQPETVAPVDAKAPSAGPETKNASSSSASELRKNKFQYVSTQTLFSTYTYGLALPIALDAGSQALALTLLALPASFGAHYYFAWDKEYHDSHLLGTTYFASNAVLLSYALPLLVMGADANTFRVGSFALLAAYPFGVNYGYKHGSRFQNEPGRISLQSTFAFTSGLLGAFGILLWADATDSPELGTRLSVVQIAGAAIAGHYLSYRYRTHEKVPGGIGPGIGSFTLMGGLASIALLTGIEPDSPQFISLGLLGGFGGGFLAGLNFFKDKYDNFERAGYNGLGMVAGAVTPIGFMLLAGSEFEEPAPVFWTLTAGAIAGYAITRHFTSSMVETPRSFSSHSGWIKSFALQPMPIPMAEKVDGKLSLKVVMPILSATF